MRVRIATPIFAGELFGPGQTLDTAKYYIVLPDGNGCDLLIELLKIRKVKSIALTAHAMVHEMPRLERAGFDRVVIKPFTVEQLDNAIDSLLR